MEEASCKVVNVMEILYFYENVFSFYDKVSSHLDLVMVFLKYFHPNLPCDVQQIFIIQYAVRKNIFACLFSVHIQLSFHVMNKYV